MRRRHSISYIGKKRAADETICRHVHYREFHRIHKSLRFMRPLFLAFTLIIVYLLFRWAGLKVIGISIATLIIFKEIVQLYFLGRLEKRVLRPIDKLQNGFMEIARGNYDVSIDPCCQNEFGDLIRSFNDMASKLRESEKTNLEYEENRRNLIANISHDLKTPITSIQGYLEMIMDNDLVQPEKINPYLKTIYNNTTYMNKLIDDLFLFSKLDVDKVEFNYEMVNIRAFMNDLMDEARFEMGEIGAEFIYEDKLDQDAMIRIDGKRVHQAVKNILGNAIKYGPESGLEIKVELFRQDEFVGIAVSDNGPGIAPERVPYIFERFYRIDQERSKDLVSTGLGLAIAKELIEAQGGRILVASSVGRGSRFTICLPVINPSEGGV
ncbi:MAG: HAMP domain-containing sensor histidine kinase [Syntrophomonadaceae bacterium]|nr:HAMP domain-containing sensor histidine kinase [Syntrophomonadaceae bacterium]